jgi:hypothetical protein
MSDSLFSEQTSPLSEQISSANLTDGISQRPKRGWLAVLWIFSTVVAMAGWWSGLAWGVAWLVERAFS